jgi:hypothetical protein
MATNPREPAPEHGRETRKAAEQPTQTVRSMSDATERTARIASDSARRTTESAEAMWRDGTEAASRIAQRSMDQLSRMMGLSGEAIRESVERTSGNMQAVLQSATDVAGGLQDVTGEWMRCAQRQVEHNLNHLEELGQCRTFHDYVALQTQMVRENMETLLQGVRKTSERSTHIADKAVQRMSESAQSGR